MPAEAGKIQLKGVDQLIKEVDRLGGNIKTAAGQALRAASRPIISAAKAGAVRRTGLLRKSLGVVVRRPRKGSPYAAIGPRRGFKVLNGKRYSDPAKYGHLVEGGAKRHEITVYDRDPNTHKLTGTKHKVMHPGAKAKPFLAPALSAAGPQAMVVLRTKFVSIIEKHKAKVLTL